LDVSREFTLDDDISGFGALPFSLERAAKIVHDNTGAARGKERGICLSKTTLMKWISGRGSRGAGYLQRQ